MSARNAARVAWGLCGLTLALITCAVALFVLNRGEQDVSFLISEAVGALVGGLISARRPTNPVGWLISGHAFCFTLGEFTRQYAIYGLLTEPDSLPFARAMAWPPYWIWYPGLMLMLTFLPLYFPNGRLVSPRWRPVVWLAVFVALIATGLNMVRPGEDEGIPNPLGIEGLQSLQPLTGALDVVIPASWLAIGVAAAMSLVVRYLRSRGEERQQIKWFAYAVVLVISFSLVNQLFPRIFPPTVDSILLTAVFASPWVAIAVAVLKYRLYDIDRIVNRTLVYGSLTATLALVYVGSVVLLQYVFRAVSGGDSQLAIVASTLVIAALFGPLRRRVQAFIDRRFYRRKYDTAQTLAQFGAKLRDETDLKALSEDLVSVVQETMQPAHASLWLREPGVRRKLNSDS